MQYAVNIASMAKTSCVIHSCWAMEREILLRMSYALQPGDRE